MPPAPRNDGKNLLAAAFLNRLLALYHSGDSGGYVRRYREKSILTGKPVFIETAGGREEALALDIDDQCGLRVQFSDGSTKTLTSGEVTIRQIH